MAGDSKACRENALRCANLAHEARSPELKMTLVNLSQNWLKLAIELEQMDKLMDDFPVPVPPKRR